MKVVSYAPIYSVPLTFGSICILVSPFLIWFQTAGVGAGLPHFYVDYIQGNWMNLNPNTALPYVIPTWSPAILFTLVLYPIGVFIAVVALLLRRSWAYQGLFCLTTSLLWLLLPLMDARNLGMVSLLFWPYVNQWIRMGPIVALIGSVLLELSYFVNRRNVGILQRERVDVQRISWRFFLSLGSLDRSKPVSSSARLLS